MTEIIEISDSDGEIGIDPGLRQIYPTKKESQMLSKKGKVKLIISGKKKKKHPHENILDIVEGEEEEENGNSNRLLRNEEITNSTKSGVQSSSSSSCGGGHDNNIDHPQFLILPPSPSPSSSSSSSSHHHHQEQREVTTSILCNPISSSSSTWSSSNHFPPPPPLASSSSSSTNTHNSYAGILDDIMNNKADLETFYDDFRHIDAEFSNEAELLLNNDVISSGLNEPEVVENINEIHSLASHDETQLANSSCSEIDLKNLVLKKKKNNDRKIYSCHYCDYKGRRQFWLIHMKTEHSLSEGLLFCDSCGDPFKSRGELSDHIITFHPESHKCELCNKEFKYPSYLKAHLKTHDNKCDEDNNNSSGSSSAGNYMCTFCGRSFKTRTGFRAHEASVHTKNLRHKCKIEGCNAAFFAAADLKIHTRKHTGELPYTCTFCGARYACSARLITHEKSRHIETQLEECHICGKAIKKKNMSLHVKQHKGLTKCWCRHCGKEFPTSGGRRRHEKIHLEDKRHCCSYCGKAFVQRSNMISHERIHTGEKPFPCRHCGDRFVQQTRRNQHQINCKQRAFQSSSFIASTINHK